MPVIIGHSSRATGCVRCHAAQHRLTYQVHRTRPAGIPRTGLLWHTSSDSGSRLKSQHHGVTELAVDAVHSSFDPASSNGSTIETSSEDVQQLLDTSEDTSQKSTGNFIKRVIFGTVLGLAGTAVVAVGKIPLLLAAMFVAYQSTQEYYSFITSKGISQGMTPPSPFVSAMTTVLCLSITVLTYLSKGTSGTAMSVAAFLLLVMNVVTLKKPAFGTLTSSVFGLFYCGKQHGCGPQQI